MCKPTCECQKIEDDRIDKARQEANEQARDDLREIYGEEGE